MERMMIQNHPKLPSKLSNIVIWWNQNFVKLVTYHNDDQLNEIVQYKKLAQINRIIIIDICHLQNKFIYITP